MTLYSKNPGSHGVFLATVAIYVIERQNEAREFKQVDQEMH